MKHPIDVHVGKRIRHRRWMTTTTQQQLAEKVGIKFQQIQKYETGQNRVSASRLWDIAHALDVAVAWFFEGMEGDAAAQEVATDPEAAMRQRRIYEAARVIEALPDAQRDAVLRMARSLGEGAGA